MQNIAMYLGLGLVLTFMGSAMGTMCNVSESELHDLRVQSFVKMQNSTNFNCGEFTEWLNTYVKEDGTFMLPYIGAYSGRDAVFEYYQLALPPGGGCSNFFGFQFLKLDNTPLPSSIVKLSENVYEGYHITDGYFNPDPMTGQFTVITKGHLTYGKVQFVECSDVIDHWLTGVENNEITDVAVGNAAVSTPEETCGLMSAAQDVFAYRFGYYPSNVTGFDLSNQNQAGFADCITYWYGVLAKGDVCGTPVTTHTIDCANLHMTTFLTEGSRAVHAEHWAKASLHTKCIDYCVPLLATCHANASNIPRNEINFANGVIEYFCQCPEGWVGDGVNSCTPVTCEHNWECEPYEYTYCDTNEHVCKPRTTFEWDRDVGEASCPDGSNVWYNSVTGSPECLLEHRCREQWQCTTQDYSSVQCVQTGNLASDFGACVCNAGYGGGYTVPCTCESPKTQQYVQSGGYKVCLDVGECVYSYDCAWDDQCVVAPGEIIGHCE